MNLLALYGLCIIGLVTAWLLGRRVRAWWKARKRKALYRKPFPEQWQHILQQHFALYRYLPENLRQALHARINYFIASKKFVARGDMLIDDEVRVNIAGQACLLVLAEEGEIYPGFRTIMVYPDTFYSDTNQQDGAVVSHQRRHRAGESWHRGPVILSWGDVLRGGANEDDGFNVVMHEFAHKLDEQNMAVNGQPLLREHSHYGEWVRILNSEYAAFLRRVERRKNKVMDAYGAESPPEFFAVATESFFEKSIAMRDRLPVLYAQLQRFYQLDPASWQDTTEKSHSE
ncbi:MAG: zinc-dependent peptidase [Gammaproteobacteria bacterium]|nr:zinc-dependent peptidase [Gammaproteobacteria bacterium]